MVALAGMASVVEEPGCSTEGRRPIENPGFVQDAFHSVGGLGALSQPPGRPVLFEGYSRRVFHWIVIADPF